MIPERIQKGNFCEAANDRVGYFFLVAEEPRGTNFEVVSLLISERHVTNMRLTALGDAAASFRQ